MAVARLVATAAMLYEQCSVMAGWVGVAEGGGWRGESLRTSHGTNDCEQGIMRWDGKGRPTIFCVSKSFGSSDSDSGQKFANPTAPTTFTPYSAHHPPNVTPTSIDATTEVQWPQVVAVAAVLVSSCLIVSSRFF